MNRKPSTLNILIRWRWAITVGAAGEALAAVHHYQRHDVTGWPVPSTLVLPLLTVGTVGLCALAIMIWAVYFSRRPAAR